MEYKLFSQSAYAALGFTSIEGMTASEDALKAARKEINLQSHSDRLGAILGRPPTAAEIQAAKDRPGLANAAIDLLKDPQQRALHDAEILQNPLRRTELVKTVEAFRNQQFDTGEALRKKHGFTLAEIDTEHKRQEQVLAGQRAQAAAAAARASATSTAGSFRTEAGNPGARPTMSQMVAEKRAYIDRLIGSLIYDPENADAKNRFLREASTGALSGDLLAAYANENQERHYLQFYHSKHRKNLAVMAEAIKLQPALAGYVVSHAFYAVGELNGGVPEESLVLIKSIIQHNPQAITPEALNAFCSRPINEFDKERKAIFANLVIEILDANERYPGYADLADAAISGALNKLYYEPKNKDYRALFYRVFDTGAIRDNTIDGFLQANNNTSDRTRGGYDREAFNEAISHARGERAKGRRASAAQQHYRR